MDREMILSLLRRSMDAARFNEIANHPEVRPWLGGAPGPLDMAPLVCNPANIALLSPLGGFILHKLGDGRYEAHTLFLPEGRGAHVVECMREGFRYMFCATDCVEVVTKCPDGNVGAGGLAREAGFQEIFRRERAFNEGVGVSYRSLTLDRWRSRDPVIEAWGRKFHDQLEQAKIRALSQLPIHDDDPAHDRAVGASALMALNGNPRKAVWSYNRWAAFAGYAPITLLSEAPVLIDVVDAIVTPRGEDMEILLCREGPH